MCANTDIYTHACQIKTTPHTQMPPSPPSQSVHMHNLRNAKAHCARNASGVQLLNKHELEQIQKKSPPPPRRTAAESRRIIPFPFIAGIHAGNAHRDAFEIKERQEFFNLNYANEGDSCVSHDDDDNGDSTSPGAPRHKSGTWNMRRHAHNFSSFMCVCLCVYADVYAHVCDVLWWWR